MEQEEEKYYFTNQKRRVITGYKYAAARLRVKRVKKRSIELGTIRFGAGVE